LRFFAAISLKVDQQTPPPPLNARAVIRQEHLRLLSIGYYIYGGIAAFSVCIFLVHLVVLIVFAVVPDSAWTANQGTEFSPRFLFLIMAGVVGSLIIAGWALGGLTIFAGRCIRNRKRYVFTLIIAAINCVFVPFGTLLGVLTFIHLRQPDTKNEFQRPATSPIAP
jgi:hypothetical protein